MTVYWGDKFLAIKNRLKDQIALLEDDEGELVFDEVKVGKKQKPVKDKSCIILPVPIRASRITVSKSVYNYRFDIRVIGKDNDIEDGLDEVVEYSNYIVAFLEDDRQFNHICRNLEIINIDPDVERPRARTRHELSILAEFETHGIPSG